jgi:rhodanese-related sulfurtransferase
MSAPVLTAATPMGEVMAALPGARRALFSHYHLGGCGSCGFSPAETLAELCARSGPLDPAEVLARLLEAHAHDAAMLVTPEDARAALAATPPPVLLDTRTREEHEAVAIPGSELLTQLSQQQLFATASPDQLILLYDHHGDRVLDTCAWFHGHGLKGTRAINGGIDAWSRLVDPSIPRYRLEFDPTETTLLG